MLDILHGQLALDTGGSGTIGLAIVTALAVQGATVVVTGRNVTNLEKAVQRVQKCLSWCSIQE